MKVTVREIENKDAIRVVDYFLNSDQIFLKKMGADKSKLPQRDNWVTNIQRDIYKEYIDKNAFYVIWLLNNKPIGHSNINNIKYGESAEMHLHLWELDKRKSGLGIKFLQQTITLYFTKFKIKTIICEPNSKNEAPNKILKKIGFKFIRAYETLPSPIALYQIVNRYELKKEDF